MENPEVIAGAAQQDKSNQNKPAGRYELSQWLYCHLSAWSRTEALYSRYFLPPTFPMWLVQILTTWVDTHSLTDMQVLCLTGTGEAGNRKSTASIQSKQICRQGFSFDWKVSRILKRCEVSGPIKVLDWCVRAPHPLCWLDAVQVKGEQKPSFLKTHKKVSLQFLWVTFCWTYRTNLAEGTVLMRYRLCLHS